MARVEQRFAPDSPLEEAGFELVWGFSCQVVVFGLLPVLCSEREGPFFVPSPAIRFSDLEGLRVAVQGLGNVGMPLCGYLSAAGAALVVSDLDGNRCAQAAATYGATLAAPEEIHAQHVDVFVPAALGAVLNDATIPCLRCRVVCGGANNQLAEARHDAALAVRGIVFVPDYLANAGGVIDFHQETIDDQPDAVLASVARIGAITRGVLRCAAATGATPLSVADGIVRARIIRRA